MLLHFLRAEVPLTKEFRREEDGTITKTSYPFVKKFWSVDYPVDSIYAFAEALQYHASQNDCLLKGKLSRRLQGESRAGTTDNMLDKTEWVVFDIDGLPGIETPEAFVELLPAQFQDVTYVVQLSASYGLDAREGLRCHIFFMLEEEVLPNQIKGWIKEYNLFNETLHQHTDLSANAVTLKYPLDITVAQNDKLIYIAPPLCHGMEDPHADQRIRLVEKGNGRVAFTFPFDPARTNDMERQRVGELRVARGLRRKTPKFRDLGGEQLLTNPETAHVTGEKEQNGFIRVNVNGGDSWGYYYNPENPKYLRNFKGEPTVVLRDFCPEYWRDIQNRMVREGGEMAERPLIFNDPVADCYYKGIYDPVNNRHEIYQCGSKDKLRDFATAHHIELPDPIHDWRVEFRPDLETVCDERNRFINLYQPTELWKAARYDEETTIPFQTDRILRSICVDEETYQHFLNWLAVVVQTKVKTGTAWIFQGVQGTGKGLLVNHVLAPILGEDYVVTRQLNDFNDQFNAYLEKAIVLCIDESSIQNSRETHKIANILKQYVTEDRVRIRGMRQNERSVRTWCNVIITSNDFDPMKIEQSDRRYNVAPRQETPLPFNTDDMTQLMSEVGQFATFLNSYDADLEKARVPIKNEAKEKVREASRDNFEEVVERFRSGDLAWFSEELAEGITGNDHVAYGEACEQIIEWLDDAIAGKRTRLLRAGFSRFYSYWAGIKAPNRGKLGKRLEHKNFDVPTRRGRIIEWQITPFEAQELKKRLAKARRGALG